MFSRIPRFGGCHLFPGRRLSSAGPMGPDLLDAVISAVGPALAADGGCYPLQIPARYVPWGHRVNTVRSGGKYRGVTGYVPPGHRPSTVTVGTGRNALFGRGHPRKPRVRKHLQVSAGPRKSAQQMLLTQGVARHGLRACHGRLCWALGRAVSGASGHSLVGLTRSILPC